MRVTGQEFVPSRGSRVTRSVTSNPLEGHGAGICTLLRVACDSIGDEQPLRGLCCVSYFLCDFGGHSIYRLRRSIPPLPPTARPTPNPPPTALLLRFLLIIELFVGPPLDRVISDPPEGLNNREVRIMYLNISLPYGTGCNLIYRTVAI